MNGFAYIEGETKFQTYRRALRRLETSTWSKGTAIGRIATPGARPRAIAAGARKLTDIAWAHARTFSGKGPRSCIAA